MSQKKFWLSVVCILCCGLAAVGMLRFAEPQRSAQAHEEAREAASADMESEGTDRDAWFYEQRAYPQKTIPLQARRRAFEQLEQRQSRRQRRGLGELK